MKGDGLMSESLMGCSLSTEQYVNVTEVYARAARIYIATVEFIDDRATIDLCGPKVPIRALLDDMIAREGDCCTHFQFDVTEMGDGYRVELSVPSASEIAPAALRQAVPAFFPFATISRER